MFARLRKTYDFEGPVIIGYAFFVANGAWRSIYNYFRMREAEGLPAKLIDRRNIRTFRQFLAAFFFGRHVIFNSLDCFWHWEALAFCLMRRDTMVYLHDTEHTLDGFAREHPFKYRLLGRILRRNRVLSVSTAAADLYRRRFGAQRTLVVYENLADRKIPDFEPGVKHIVMTGVLDARKGVELFSSVADRAKELGLPWRFHWLGGIHSKDAGRHSANVTWWGWVDNVDEFLAKADVFFLSSKDDPFPLSCLEALRARRRCVAYAATGVAEAMRGVAGCAVYEAHTVESAFAAIKHVLGEAPDEAAFARVHDEFIKVAAFSRRMDAILGTSASESGQ
ncbi:MAG TPA: glycosyltransferase [Opitutaceae bacterium]|nr:glycosyltransferase [Opitutaceae bacterium]